MTVSVQLEVRLERVGVLDQFISAHISYASIFAEVVREIRTEPYALSEVYCSFCIFVADAIGQIE